MTRAKAFFDARGCIRSRHRPISWRSPPAAQLGENHSFSSTIYHTVERVWYEGLGRLWAVSENVR
ncbi:hypothetical protein UA45_16050, partial [Morganella morganii]